MHVVKNGQAIEEEKANISVFNKAFFFDFAVYGSIKVVKGKPFYVKNGLEKLLNSAKELKLKHSFTRKEIADWLQLLIEKNKLENALVRLLLIGAASEHEEPQLFLFPVGLTFHPKKFFNQGVKVISFHGERFLPQAKSMNLLLNFLAFRKAREKDALDAILVGKEGYIAEGTRSSFFAIKGNTLFAPPKEKVLEGVTRKLVLQIASKIMEVKEEDIPLEKIGEFDECFISSVSMGIMPVRQVDGIEFKVGEKTKALQKLFKEIET